MLEKWNRKYSLSEKVDHIQEIYAEVGVRNCYGEKDRHTFSVINQLVSGHTNLNVYKAKLDKKRITTLHKMSGTRRCGALYVPL